MINMDKTIQSTAIKLEAIGVPPDRAQVKAEGTVIGKFASFVGLLLCLGTVVTTVLLLVKGVELTITAAVVILVPGMVGLVVMFVGASLMSRDASPALAAVGEFFVKIIKAIKGN